MDASIVVAQAASPSAGASATSPRLIHLTKPHDNQAVFLLLDGRTQLDFSAISNENLTLVHAGDKLVVLFDNHATVTLAPAFSADGKLLPDITFEVTPDHIVSGTEFATLHPITTDESVLPAAAPPSSGAYFLDVPEVVPLGPDQHALPFDHPADMHQSHVATAAQFSHVDIIHHPRLPCDDVIRMMIDASQSHAHV
jgi:hypothetical protein